MPSGDSTLLPPDSLPLCVQQRGDEAKEVCHLPGHENKNLVCSFIKTAPVLLLLPADLAYYALIVPLPGIPDIPGHPLHRPLPPMHFFIGLSTMHPPPQAATKAAPSS